jgi:CBS domain containing-hemolysin-like protein
MCAASNDECVLENELLEVAMHKLATGRHQSLLVTRDDGVVGILRLTDVFEQIAGADEDCSESGTQ